MIAGLLATLMRVNAEEQGQAKATAIATEQKNNAAKTKIELKPGGVATLKDVDLSLLNGTQDDEIRAAYQAPKDAVAQKLGDYGYVPEDVNITPDEVDSYTERYKARRQLGGSVIKSALMAGITGSTRDEALRKNLQNRNATVNNMRLQKEVQPIEDQAIEAGRLANTMRTEDRLAKEAEAKEDLRVRSVIKDTNWLLIPPTERNAALQELTGLQPDAARRYGRLVQTTIATQAEEDRTDRITAFRKDNATLGQFKTWNDAKSSLGVPLSEEEEGQARHDWAAAREATERARQDQLLQVYASQRAAASADRATDAADRATRTEQRSIEKDRAAQHQKRIDTLVNDIKKNNAIIEKNTVDVTKERNAKTRAALEQQKRSAIQRNLRLRQQLDGLLGKAGVSGPAKPAGRRTVLSAEEALSRL